MAERYPARRGLYLRYWARTHRATYLRYLNIAVTPVTSGGDPVAIIRRVFGVAASSAISVARCESGLDPFAHNPSGAAGLFQLMPVHWEAQGYDPYDAGTNTRIAWHLYEHSGWSAWQCQP